MSLIFLDIDGVLSSEKTALLYGGFPFGFSPDEKYVLVLVNPGELKPFEVDKNDAIRVYNRALDIVIKTGDELPGIYDGVTVEPY